ncbi:MAG: CDP-alcohol phosphatidyltransferase family protein [Thermoproteus sp. AZ2]|uniref:CDP-alcohol phosphatidyltransferase family protein n=1 Tax=Thermoproteus sp. AZ2 TaxID=1609232 RepID=A0ACC6V1R7_9CREN|nr:MAG: CDP-diacylglycerol--glycerol-3-phosphate 3-phosphatidyltransferase [Thermoproteus sp. AZ2]
MIEKLRKYINLDSLGRYIPLPADAVTALSLAVALLGLWLVPLGVPPWVFIAVVGALDVLDGAVARARGSPTRSGALLDSTLDRAADAVILLYFPWRSPALLTAALAGTFLISYVRARAESLGLSMRGVGFMERGERLIYLFLASIVSELYRPALGPALYLYTALVDVAATYRFLEAYRALKAPNF